MAERRMFAKSIIDSDVFLDMPLSTQALYFHLSMRADDDGFVSNPKRIRMLIGASEDDLKLLILKRYILTFDSGIIVIKHWKMHNYIQRDRYKPTTYIEEKSQLELDEKKAYVECTQNVYKADTQDRIGKDRIGKDNIDYIVEKISEKEEIFNFWNEKNIIKHRNLTKEIENSLEKALKKLNKDMIIECIDRYSQVLSDNNFYFDYKWSLTDFLNRKNGISSFTDEGSMWVSYITSKNKTNQITNENVDDLAKQLEQRINARKGIDSGYGI